MEKPCLAIENKENDEHDFLELSLGPPMARTTSTPAPTLSSPPTMPYLSLYFGPDQDQTLSKLASTFAPSFHPYIRPYPQNPNPNLRNPNPDFGTFHQSQNTNPNLNPNPNVLPSLESTSSTPSQNPKTNPNPDLASQSSFFVPDFGIPRSKNPNPSPKFLLTQNPNPNLKVLQSQNPNPSPISEPTGTRQSAVRRRRNSANRGLRAGKSETVAAPFNWASNRRGGVLSLEELADKGIETVSGEVQCRRCEKRFEVGFEVRTVFSKLREFISENKEKLRDRSAPEWDDPAMIDCRFCHAKEAAKAVVADKKREINWLFLLLGGFLCCCTLEQLKYFCKHTGNHRTGAKNRVLYLTYLALCKQLDPSGPFDALAD